MANALTKKAGPLPVWAWGILGGIAVYFLYTRYSSSSANSAANSPVATALDPNAVDPTTGLTYGQELAGGSPAVGGLQGAADNSSGTPSFDSQLQDLATILGDFSTIAGQLGYTPPNPSSTTTDAAGSAPVDNSQPVATNGNDLVNRGPFSAAQLKQLKGLRGASKKVQTKNPASHRAKTIHAANPQGHQHKVTKPKSTAKPHPVKHPAGGGQPGKVQSGSHAKPTTAPSHTGHPVARNPHPNSPPRPKPHRHRGP